MNVLDIAIGMALAVAAYFAYLVAKMGWAYAAATFSGLWNSGVKDAQAAIADVKAIVSSLEARVAAMEKSAAVKPPSPVTLMPASVAVPPVPGAGG